MTSCLDALSVRCGIGAGTVTAPVARTIPVANVSASSSAACRMVYDHKYVYSHIGYNLKVTDMQAAVGVAQLDKLEGFITRRKANFQKIFAMLLPYQDRLLLPHATPNSDPAWFGFVLTVRDQAGFTRNELTGFLEANHIETRALFAGNLLRQPAFMDIQHRSVAIWSIPIPSMENTFFIGVYPGIEDSQLDYIDSIFRRFMSGESRLDAAKIALPGN